MIEHRRTAGAFERVRRDGSRAAARGMVAGLLVALAVGGLAGCPPTVDATALRACLGVETCGQCVGSRPRGVTCGWCQLGDSTHCIPAGQGDAVPVSCQGGRWVVNTAATACPVIPRPDGGAPDPNE